MLDVVNPRATVRAEGLYKLKIPMTSSGIEPTIIFYVYQWNISEVTSENLILYSFSSSCEKFISPSLQNNTHMILRWEVRVVWWIINTGLAKRKYIQNFYLLLNLIKKLTPWSRRFWNDLLTVYPFKDRLYGLVVRVSGYRYRGLGFDSRRYQIFLLVVGLERGPLSLVRSIEELLE